MIISQQAPRPTFVEKLPGTVVEFKMVSIPAGEIQIEGKKHAIKEFWIGETEVTWDVFDVWAYRMDLTEKQKAEDFDAENRPSRPYGAPDRGYGHQGFAALSMTHAGAKAFCKWLSEKTGRAYRLPSEAEWEYAARAGSSSLPVLEDAGWFWENADDAAHPVGAKKPNGWGLFDMLGNASEWCSPSVGDDPVVRGGNFTTKLADVSFDMRQKYHPSWQMRDAQMPKSSWWLSDGEFVGMRLMCEK